MQENKLTIEELLEILSKSIEQYESKHPRKSNVSCKIEFYEEDKVYSWGEHGFYEREGGIS